MNEAMEVDVSDASVLDESLMLLLVFKSYMQKYVHFGREIASILIYLKTIILLLHVRIYNICIIF